MVMWFNVKEARERLLKEGWVFTLRPKLRREGKEPLFYNEFKKKGEVSVELWATDPADEILRIITQFSGFKTLEEWREKAKDCKYVYLVRLINES